MAWLAYDEFTGTDGAELSAYTTTNNGPKMVAVVGGTLDNLHVRWMTAKDAAIEEIKAQPFFAPNA